MAKLDFAAGLMGALAAGGNRYNEFLMQDMAEERRQREAEEADKRAINREQLMAEFRSKVQLETAQKEREQQLAFNTSPEAVAAEQAKAQRTLDAALLAELEKTKQEETNPVFVGKRERTRKEKLEETKISQAPQWARINTERQQDAEKQQALGALASANEDYLFAAEKLKTAKVDGADKNTLAQLKTQLNQAEDAVRAAYKSAGKFGLLRPAAKEDKREDTAEVKETVKDVATGTERVVTRRVPVSQLVGSQTPATQGARPELPPEYIERARKALEQMRAEEAAKRAKQAQNTGDAAYQSWQSTLR